MKVSIFQVGCCFSVRSHVGEVSRQELWIVLVVIRSSVPATAVVLKFCQEVNPVAALPASLSFGIMETGW